MITQAFCLYDTKTGIYGVPFFMQHVGEAVRACQDLANDMNTTVGRHPADFMLVRLGSYNDAVGAFDNQQEHIGTVVSMVRPPERQSPLFEHPAGAATAAYGEA